MIGKKLILRVLDKGRAEGYFHRPMRLFLTSVLFICGLLPEMAEARSPDREVLAFSVVTNIGFGNNVHVVGSHPDVGSWNPVNSIKLRWTTGNVWTGQVAVQKGTALEYKFIGRSIASNLYCDGNNANWEPGTNRVANMPPAPPAPYQGKTLYYYSTWTSAYVLVIGPTNIAYPMTRIGNGPDAGEYLYKVEGLGEAGDWMEFVPNGYSGGNLSWDNPPAPETNQNYRTRLDAFVLQAGNIYNYWPSNNVSAPRKETRSVGSSFSPPIDGRDIVVVLPRGYDSHPWKRYPVIYFQDGQNITNGANVFGNGSWDADLIARREAAAGRMREVILVGVYNYPERRRWEYNPPGDQYPGDQPGRADAYLNFLIHNVRPTIDSNYRTLNDYRNTMVAGSSMGGIFSLYAGLESNVFGGVLAMSPALTRAPNYKASLSGKLKKNIRMYMDTGTNEGKVGPPDQPGGYYWDDPWDAYNSFLTAGYVPNHDLLMRIGCGHFHNEVAWRTRLPEAYFFLLNILDEANRVALQEWPPEITRMPDINSANFMSQRLINYRIEESTSGAWAFAGSSFVETNAWAARSLSAASPITDIKFLRVTGTPQD